MENTSSYSNQAEMPPPEADEATSFQKEKPMESGDTAAPEEHKVEEGGSSVTDSMRAFTDSFSQSSSADKERTTLQPVGADEAAPEDTPAEASVDDGAVTFEDHELDEVDAAMGESAPPADPVETYADSIRSAAAAAAEGGPAAALLGEKTTYDERPTHVEVSDKEAMVAEVADEVPVESGSGSTMASAIDAVTGAFGSSTIKADTPEPTPPEQAYAASRAEAAEATEDTEAAASLMEDVPTTAEVAQKNEAVADLGMSVPTQENPGKTDAIKDAALGLLGMGAAAGVAAEAAETGAGHPDPVQTYSESIAEAADSAGADAFVTGGESNADGLRPTAEEIMDHEALVGEVEDSVPLETGRVGMRDTLASAAKALWEQPKATMPEQSAEERFATSRTAAAEAESTDASKQQEILSGAPTSTETGMKKDMTAEVGKAAVASGATSATGGILGSLMGSSSTKAEDMPEGMALWEQAAYVYGESVVEAAENPEVDNALDMENVPTTEKVEGQSERPTYDEVTQHMNMAYEVLDTVKTTDGPSLLERAGEALAAATASSTVKSGVEMEGAGLESAEGDAQVLRGPLADGETPASSDDSVVGQSEASSEYASSRRASAPAGSMTDSMMSSLKSMMGGSSEPPVEESHQEDA